MTAALQAGPDPDIARRYFDALASGDLSGVAYAEDAILWAPLGPKGLAEPIRGREAILAYLGGVTPSIQAVEVQNLFASDDWIAGRAQLVFSEPRGTRLRVFDAFRIRGGEIVEQENHYDPRPVLG